MNARSEDTIHPAEAVTLDGLLRQRLERSAEAEAYRSFDRSTGHWTAWRWSEVAARVAMWQSALVGEGLKPGDRVAVSLRNGPDWVVFDQAALGLGLVVVPLYTDDRPDNSAFILQDSGAALLVIQDLAHWRRLAPALGQPSPLRRVLLLDGDAEGEGEPVRSVATWLREGNHTLQSRQQDPDALATIVYTSGTTGRPKGVMLSHRNILSVAHAALTVVPVYREDRFLSFLPLSHTLERTAGYYLPMMAGASVAYARSIAQLAEDLVAVRPTVMIAVPRIFERIHGRLRQQLDNGGAIRRRLFAAAVSLGWRRHREHARPLLWPLLQRLVARPFLARLGGGLRLVVSGGAPLPPEIARIFIGLGLPILQGYGLTETSPQISVNLPQDNDPASVGRVLPGTEARIGENDELQVRGPGVMLGYWRNPEATAALIGKDGWLHTGDQARIDGGRVYLTGRIKDILVLSNGEKVAPAEMEMAIGLDPLFEQVMVVGEGRPFLAALLVLNAELWKPLAEGLGLDAGAPVCLEDKKLHHLILQRLSAQLHDFPAWAKVRRVHLSLEPWSIDNGLLTPTLKVKRKQVLERHGEVVATIYRQGLTG